MVMCPEKPIILLLMARFKPKPVLNEMIINIIPKTIASVAAVITGPMIEPLVFRAFCIFRAM